MGKTTKAAVVKAKKTTKAAATSAPKLEFVSVKETELKQTDKAFKSAVIGALAVDNSFELPLAVTLDGKQAYSLDNVRRATCAIYDALKGKLKVTLAERSGQDGVYFVVIFTKTKTASRMAFADAAAADKKILSSAKRTKRAAANKAAAKKADDDKADDAVKTLQTQADKAAAALTAQKEKHAAAVKVGDTKAALKAAQQSAIERDSAFRLSAAALIIKRFGITDGALVDKAAADLSSLARKFYTI